MTVGCRVRMTALVADVDGILGFGLDVELRGQQRIARGGRRVGCEHVLEVGFALDCSAEIVDRIDLVALRVAFTVHGRAV